MKKIIFISLFSLIIQTFTGKIYAQNLLEVGDKMPKFYLLDQYGREFNSENYIGKQPLIVFFYTEDDSDVSTERIISFRNKNSSFKFFNAKIIGINPGYLYYHTLFANKNKIMYTILADKYNEVQKKFGVPNARGTKNPRRYTFVIDKKGIIRLVYYNKKDIESHIDEVLRILNDIIDE